MSDERYFIATMTNAQPRMEGSVLNILRVRSLIFRATHTKRWRNTTRGPPHKVERGRRGAQKFWGDLGAKEQGDRGNRGNRGI